MVEFIISEKEGEGRRRLVWEGRWGFLNVEDLEGGGILS